MRIFLLRKGIRLSKQRFINIGICSILDSYDRSIAASVNGTYINTELAKKALEKALKSEKPQEELILHSDQSYQFTSWGFVSCCKEKW